MFDKEIGEVKDLLSRSSQVVITSHHNPDGDAVGSMLGLYHTLKTMGIEASMVLPNDFPRFLSWLPSSKRITKYSYSPDKVTRIIANADLIFSLDYNGLGRLEAMASLVEASKAMRVLIDHHPNPESPFNVMISNTQASSTAELVFEVACGLTGLESINEYAAQSMFVGIMTDTGSFSYACSNPHTFEVTAKLIAQGANVERAQDKIYNNFSEGRMKLTGYALSQKMQVFPNHCAAYISLTRKELNDFNHSVGDTEGLVNLPLSIKGIKFSALLTENEGYVKVSLRSRGNFPANMVCKEHFMGGGHMNAAGGKVFGTMEQAEKLFEEVIEGYSKELNDAS
jgi:bifunctional oligoribonuclease and PAP phosphatase NrnA